VGQTSGEIRDQIDQQREQLGQNLHNLEERVKEKVDWRTQFEQRPMAGLGIAFGTGFLLSMLIPSGDDDKNARREWSSSYVPPPSEPRHNWQTAGISSSYASEPRKQRSPEMNEISETVDLVKGALLGLAATRLRGYLADAVPGFKDEYEQAAKQRGTSDASRIDTGDGDQGSRAGSAHDVAGYGRQQMSDTMTDQTSDRPRTPGTQIANTAVSGTRVPTAGDATTPSGANYRS
jgi:hypothetical protein